MPVNYGVLRGSVINSIPYVSGTDHYQIEVSADELYRVPVNVYSQLAGTLYMNSEGIMLLLDTSRMVMFYKDENYKHPVLEPMRNLVNTFTPDALLDARLRLDYIHGMPPLFPLDQMRVVKPASDASPGENLNGDISPWVQKATNNPDAELFVFGSGWDDNAPGSHPVGRKYFNPDPAKGVHDIHMNQGDTGSSAKFNGPGQDGALFFHLKTADLWVAMFFRFQNQHITTDGNGNPM